MLGRPPPPVPSFFGFSKSAPPKPKPHLLLLKAQKKFDLSTKCLPLLSKGVPNRLNGKTIKLLLSQHIKKKSFGKMGLALRNCAFSKVISNNVKSFSCSYEGVHVLLPKPDRKLLQFIAYSYKHLEQLDLRDIDIQNKSSFASLSKLNHLQNLNMKLSARKYLHSPRFFQNLKHLRHLTLSINEATKDMKTDLVALTKVLKGLTHFSPLESFNVDICSAFSDQSESFVGTVLYYLNLLKAKRFSVRLQCSEDIDLKVEMFSSLLENADTLEYKYSRNESTKNERFEFQAPTSKKIVLFLEPSRKKQSLAYIVNTCSSLQNFYFEPNLASTLLIDLKLPQTLSTLMLKFSILQSPETFKLWEDALSNLNNLENLNLLLNSPDVQMEEWVSQLPQRASFKSLKQYHLKLEADYWRGRFEYDSFLTEWSKGVQSLCNLESLSFEANTIKLKSSDFFTKAMASLSKLKSIKLYLDLHHQQPRETLKFVLPSQNLPTLEHVWLRIFNCISKHSITKFLPELANCENLQSLTITGFNFDEEAAISILEKLTSLKAVEITTKKSMNLRINSKKKLALCQPEGLFG